MKKVIFTSGPGMVLLIALTKTKMTITTETWSIMKTCLYNIDFTFYFFIFYFLFFFFIFLLFFFIIIFFFFSKAKS